MALIDGYPVGCFATSNLKIIVGWCKQVMCIYESVYFLLPFNKLLPSQQLKMMPVYSHGVSGGCFSVACLTSLLGPHSSAMDDSSRIRLLPPPVKTYLPLVGRIHFLVAVGLSMLDILLSRYALGPHRILIGLCSVASTIGSSQHGCSPASLLSREGPCSLEGHILVKSGPSRTICPAMNSRSVHWELQFCPQNPLSSNTT